MTRKLLLIAGVAGFALTAPALADKGGKGKQTEAQAQQQQAQQQQAKPQRGGGGGQQVQRQERPQQMQRLERPQQVERQQQRVERQQVQRIERPLKVERQQQRVERQAQRLERPQRVERQGQRVERQGQRFERQAQRVERRTMPSFASPKGKVDRPFAQRAVSKQDTQQFGLRTLRQSAPVFTTREMRPMKPFKQKIDNRQVVSIGQRVEQVQSLAPVPSFFANNYVDTPQYYYRYDERLGSIYRIERNDNVVSSLIPLFGGYNVGSPWPQTYYSSYVPLGYQDYYYDTPDYFYRNDGYGIYQVDGSTQLITALVSLLMGQSPGIGQMLPASYSAYNVPIDYRANYYDTDDNWYRYGDGFIYQMDPYSRMVEARYPIYSDNYYVGEPWPAAYPDYNVPYAYRSTYYDTPQYQYRYANNGIYQVDPTTQLIKTLVALVSGNQFSIGQRMPSGYDSYNVPLDYRDRYADSDDDYYRYANGYVYRVDPDSWLIEEAYPV